MNKLAIRILLVFSMLVFPCQAKSEFNWGVGIGLQYGGILGWQGAYRFSSTKVRIAIGVIGLNLGIEQLLSNNFSVGIQGFGVGSTAGWGGFINYQLPAGGRKQWVFGLDLIRKASTSVITATSESTNVLSVSIGYNF